MKSLSFSVVTFTFALIFGVQTAFALSKDITITGVVFSSDYDTATITLSGDPGEKAVVSFEVFGKDATWMGGGPGVYTDKQPIILSNLRETFFEGISDGTTDFRLVFHICPMDKMSTGDYKFQYCSQEFVMNITYAPDQPYRDVPADHPNIKAIAYLKTEGIISGYPDGTFKPDQVINRAEFTKIIIPSKYINKLEMAEEIQKIAECVTDDLFADIPADAWYRPYICRGRESHFIGGYPDGSFRPDAPINFVEAAKIIALPPDNVYETGEEQLDRITPTISGESWYRKYVAFLANRNAIPVSITSFDQLITRGEMAEIVYRLRTAMKDKPSKTYEELAKGNNLLIGRVADVAFGYPADWGPVVHSDIDVEFPNAILTFQILDQNNRYPVESNELLQFSMRFYDNGENRYEEVCAEADGLMCESMKQSDMFEQKIQLEAKATMHIAGNPARFAERYDASSAYILRNYSFFTATNRIDIQVGYDIGDIYIAEYDRRVENGESPSISQLVAEDLGEDFAHPYAGLRKLYPEETKGMERFFAQVDAMIASMR